jgi:hypothetical protein
MSSTRVPAHRSISIEKNKRKCDAQFEENLIKIKTFYREIYDDKFHIWCIEIFIYTRFLGKKLIIITRVSLFDIFHRIINNLLYFILNTEYISQIKRKKQK